MNIPLPDIVDRDEQGKPIRLGLSSATEVMSCIEELRRPGGNPREITLGFFWEHRATHTCAWDNSLSIGVGPECGFVEFEDRTKRGRSSPEPMYFPGRENEVASFHWGAEVRVRELRDCLPNELQDEVIAHFLATVERSPKVEWVTLGVVA